ncbi:metallophosphoesterase family protein [Caryophanon latum]|uniref:Calcineurin-like phosphoesterase domain-containing protein n=1 Tax=Caryophanon latum TaxID=33977 RepID=A0A1C0YW71_9BACL|nr:metallophosphoesterase family protein [Caryophanon latum]OCS91380.1 hypothetical protein A6K76_09380 [Caryophanon latum]
MQIAIISDLHSNTKALKKVLRHIRDVAPQAPIVCLGDLYECTVSKKKAAFIRDMSLQDAAITSQKFEQHLQFLTVRGNQEERIAKVTGLAQFTSYPETIEIDNALFIHGHQFSWTPEWTAIFPKYAHEIIFFGHSHQAAYYVDGERHVVKHGTTITVEKKQLFINVGSVVDHYEWALYDTGIKTVTFQKAHA